MLTKIQISVRQIARSFSALALLLFSTVAGFAREVDIPTPPWRNVVDSDDTYVLYLLMGVIILLLIMIWVVSGVMKSLGTNKQLWSGIHSHKAKSVVALVGLGFLSPSMALAETSAESSGFMSDAIFWALVLTIVFLSIVLVIMLLNLSGMIKKLKGEEVEEENEQTMFTALAGTIPLSQEKDIMLDHEYDGIRELDNKLPPWWLYMFYFTIIFGVIYFPYYHFGGGELQTEEFNSAMELAEVEREERLARMANNITEANVTLMSGDADLAEGKEIFVTYCRACHLEHGGGSANSIGPNLTDEYWKHGGGIKEVFTTIKYGVTNAGMQSWQTQFSPKQMQQVASYVLSLQGTDPEGAKNPEGELWVEGEEEVSVEAAESDSTAVEDVAVADSSATE